MGQGGRTVGTARILIAEDESIIAMDLERTLIRLGFEVAYRASSGKEAIAGAEATRPDLILMDILFRDGIDGIDAAVEIRRLFDIPIIYLTANADAATVERARKSEPFAYLNKPINERDLYSNIDTALYKHRMETRLRKSQERYRSLVEGINDIVYSTDDSGLITYISPPITVYTGFMPDEIVGRHFTEFVHPEDAGRIQNIFEKLKSGGVSPAEYRVLSKIGEPVWVRTSGRPLMVRGEFEGIRGIFTVITEQKQAERLLVLQRDLAIALATQRDMKDAMELVMDAALKLEYVDSGAIYMNNEDFGGLTLRAHRGLSDEFIAVCGFYGPDSPESRLVSEKKTLHIVHSELMRGTDPVRLKEGLKALSVAPIIHEEKVIGVMNLASHSRDTFPHSTRNAIEAIAAQIGSVLAGIEAERALEEKTGELERFFNLSLDLLCIADTEGRFIRLNREWEKTLGYSLERMEGARYLDFVHPDDIEKTVRAVETLSRQRQLINFVNRYRTEGGSYRWIEWRSITSGDLVYAAARDITARIEYEEELRSREEKFSFLAENMLDIIGQLDRESRFIYISPSVTRVLGYRPEELINRIFTDNVHTDDIEKTMKKIANAVTADQSEIRFDFRYRKIDGEYIWIESEAKVLYDRDGHYTGAIFSSRNITDRRRVEEDLKKFIGIIDTTTDLVSTATMEGNLLFVNRSGKNLLGWDENETAIGKKIEDLHPKWAYRLIAKEGIPAAVRDGSWTGETALRTGRGSTIPVSQIIMAHRSRTGAVEFLSTIIRDIRFARKAEATILESESRFRKIFENSIDGILVTSRDIFVKENRFLMANPALVEMFGYDSAEELLSRPALELIGQAYRQKAINTVEAKHRGDKTPDSYEITGMRKDGTEFEIELRISAYLQERTVYLLTIVRDNTARKKVERELKNSILEKETLLKEIHHRVKNNFQLVNSMMGLQGRNTKEPGVLRELDVVRSRVRTMAQLHETLYQSQDLNSIELARYITKIVMDLHDTAGGVSDGVELEFDIQDIRLEIAQALPCGLITNELVSNSLFHAFPLGFAGKKILRVSLHEDSAGAITLAVKDTGIGFDRSGLQDERLSLGMTLVNTLANQLGGDVSFTEKKGTTVTVRFKKSS